MEKSRINKGRQQGEKLGESGVKHFAKLPANYTEMTTKEQEEWRQELAKGILESFRQHPTRPQS